MTPANTIWSRILSPAIGDLPPDTARYFLSLSIPPEDNMRYQQLAELQHFERSHEQQETLDELVRANTMLMLLQAKARLSLKQRPAA